MPMASGATDPRRAEEESHTQANGITPQSVRKGINAVLQSVYEADYVTVDTGVSGETQLIGHNLHSHLADLERRMHQAAADLEFEEAARLRDEIRRLEAVDMGLNAPGVAPNAAHAAGLPRQRHASTNKHKHTHKTKHKHSRPRRIA